MRRALTALLLVAVAAAGAGTAALARKAPPHHRHPAKHKPARHKHHRKPAHKPTVTTPAAVTTNPSTTTTPAPVTTTPADTTPAPDTTTPAAPAPAQLSHALGVTASDAPGGGFVLSLSRTVLGSGAETVNFVNRSQDGHDLRIDDAGGIAQQTWDELASLATPVTESVTLAPGTYRIYCTLHLGMEKQLTVQAG